MAVRTESGVRGGSGLDTKRHFAICSMAEVLLPMYET